MKDEERMRLLAECLTINEAKKEEPEDDWGVLIAAILNESFSLMESKNLTDEDKKVIRQAEGFFNQGYSRQEVISKINSPFNIEVIIDKHVWPRYEKIRKLAVIDESQSMTLDVDSDLKAVISMETSRTVKEFTVEGFERNGAVVKLSKPFKVASIPKHADEKGFLDWLASGFKEGLLDLAKGLTETNTTGIASAGLDTALRGGLPLCFGAKLPDKKKNGYLDVV